MPSYFKDNVNISELNQLKLGQDLFNNMTQAKVNLISRIKNWRLQSYVCVWFR